MSILINAIVAIVALVILFSIWAGVHLLARYRMGDRQLGCRGPQSDDWGNEICCHTGEVCENASNCENNTPEGSPMSASSASAKR